MMIASGAQFTLLFKIALMVCVMLFSRPVLADEHGNSIADPGFRPHSKYAPAFIDAFPTATVVVYPSIVRRPERTAVSFASQEQVVSFLSGKNLAMPVAQHTRFDLGKLQRTAQWDLFQNDMQAIAETLEKKGFEADYHLVMEFVYHPDNQGIFGIHCYILDRHGRNAFSFLLNSHHRLFSDAKLSVDNSSQAAREILVGRATQTGLAALQAQIALAQNCATHQEVSPIIAPPGIFDDFESGLPSGLDHFGVPLGFETFDDGSSSARISTTDTYPPLPQKIAKNNVLRLDMNVTGWAGFVHIFAFYNLDQWIPYDWSNFNAISFWLYGNNSGTTLFVDILDNRNPCSTVDDAERYVYEFTDDFSGWELVNIRFADMKRKEVSNGAPNDGLGLESVHGWAFGAQNTGGPLTYYIDDFELRKTPTAKIDYPINELPMFGGREKTATQKRADKALIKDMTKGGKSRTDAAESFARIGWNSYYKNDYSTAIRRFNQAWLLDPVNQNALWGFGAISSGRDQMEDAVRYFRMAIENGPKNPSLQRDYEFALKQLEKLELENAR